MVCLFLRGAARRRGGASAALPSVLQDASLRNAGHAVKIALACTSVAPSKRRLVKLIDTSCSPLSEGLVAVTLTQLENATHLFSPRASSRRRKEGRAPEGPRGREGTTTAVVRGAPAPRELRGAHDLARRDHEATDAGRAALHPRRAQGVPRRRLPEARLGQGGVRAAREARHVVVVDAIDASHI